MSRGQRRFTALACLLAVCILSSCGKAPHQDEHYILVAANIKLPYWQEAAGGWKDAIRQLGFGVKSDIVGPDTYDPNAELDAFKQAVSQHPAGILVSPAQSEIFKDAIDQAVTQGTPVICIDNDCPDSKRLMFVGTDNFRAGQASARRLADALGGEGLVVIITIPGQLNTDERMRGAKDVFAGYPKIKIFQVIDDKGDPGKADDGISALLNAHKDFDGVLSLEASGGSGAADAFHRLNLDGKVPIVAMDKDPETLDWISRGAINASIGQKPYTMAFYGLRFLDDLHHNAVHEFKDWRTAPASPLPTLVDTGIGVVDKDNVKDYQAAEDRFIAHPGQVTQ